MIQPLDMLFLRRFRCSSRSWCPYLGHSKRNSNTCHPRCTRKNGCSKSGQMLVPRQSILDSWIISNETTVILSLQQSSGVFAGDAFGEIDTRFLYCAVNALSLLGHLSDLDVEKTVSYIRLCRNFDGGFGARIGAESHAAQGRGRVVLGYLCYNLCH